jgi:hypothetical protein
MQKLAQTVLLMVRCRAVRPTYHTTFIPRRAHTKVQFIRLAGWRMVSRRVPVEQWFFTKRETV